MSKQFPRVRISDVVDKSKWDGSDILVQKVNSQMLANMLHIELFPRTEFKSGQFENQGVTCNLLLKDCPSLTRGEHDYYYTKL